MSPKCPSNVPQQHVLGRYDQHVVGLIQLRPQCGRNCLSGFLNLFLALGRLSVDRQPLLTKIFLILIYD